MRARLTAMLISLTLIGALVGGVIGYQLQGSGVEAQEIYEPWQTRYFQAETTDEVMVEVNDFLIALDPDCFVDTSSSTRSDDSLLFVITYSCAAV